MGGRIADQERMTGYEKQADGDFGKDKTDVV